MKDKPDGSTGKIRENFLEPEFSDPVTKSWVWIGFGLLFAALIPIWPITGNWLGIPAWAVFAVAVSALTSAFTAFVILWVWRDSKKPGLEEDDAGN